MMPRPRSLRRASVLLAVGISLALVGCGGAESRKAKHLQKGQAYLAAGSFDKARVEFQNALQIAPKDAEARFEMGVVDEKLGNPRAAAQLYQGTIEIKPEHLGARANLARLYLFSGAPDRALDMISPVIDKHPDDPALLTVRAAARVQQKNMVGALADAERAVQLAPTSEDSVAVLSGIYSTQGDRDKAQALLEQSIIKIPASVDLRLVLAQIYMTEKRPADAQALLIDLVKLKPNDAASRTRLAQFYLVDNRIDEAEKTLRTAVKEMPTSHEIRQSLIDFLTARRGYEAAEKELLAMTAAAPKDSDLKFVFASFYETNNKPDRAEAIYKGVIDQEQLNPPGLIARDRLATLYVRRGDVTGASALLKQVLDKSPRDDDALLLRGSIALQKQDPKSAVADLRAVLRDQPNAPGVLDSLARAHMMNGEPAIAEETMRRAVDANPKNLELRLDLARLLAQVNKPEQSKAVLAELLKQQPGNLGALDAQFKEAMATKDLSLAKSAAQAIVANNPKAAVGYFYQGSVSEAEKHPDEALRLYATAVDLQPTASEPLEAQIRLLMAAKRTPEALKRLDEVAAKVPESSLALNLKGSVLLSLNNLPEAETAYRAAIARTPKWWAPYRGLAAQQVAAKQPDAAIATMRNALPNVDLPEALGAELAALLVRTGKLDDAIAEYETLISNNPKSELLANNLAMLLATYRTDPTSLDRAKALSTRFANSSNPALLDTYGWVLYKRGETAASVPVLKTVVERSPDAVLARYHLGMAQSQNGDNADARQNLTRAVNSGAKFEGLAEAKATLEKIAKVAANAPASPPG